MALVATATQDQVGFITFDSPAKRNALSREMVDGIVDALAEFRRKQVRVAILRAAPGASVWSAGHDVAELPIDGRDPLGWDDPLPNLIRALESHPAPVIAMIEGTVWGGACEVAFACDLIVASPATTFAVTPAKLGVPYNVAGMVTFLNAANLRVIKEMAFTAAPITASRAEQLGLVNHVVPVPQLADFTLALAQQVAANAPLSIAVMKEQLRLLSGARPMSPQGFERIQGLRRIVYDSEDFREGILAFKEKRRPAFKGR